MIILSVTTPGREDLKTYLHIIKKKIREVKRSEELQEEQEVQEEQEEEELLREDKTIKEGDHYVNTLFKQRITTDATP